MSEFDQKTVAPLWKRILFSDMILQKSSAQKLAYIGVMAAFCIIANVALDFPLGDVQFSFTIFASVIAGIYIGPVFGFSAAFIGDLVGALVTGLVYFPWVGLATATMALIAGLVMKIPMRMKGSGYVKLAIICLLTFLVCTVGINSTGFYFYNRAAGFSEAVLSFVDSNFGGNVSYFAYCCYRLFFKLQILNSIFNYTLLFLAVTILNAINPLKIKIR